jgi:hypothetical protein
MRAGEYSLNALGGRFFCGNKGLTPGGGNFNLKRNTFYG